MSMFRYRDREIADKVINQLNKMNLEISIMHVCGTHQDTLIRYGLDDLFKKCGVTIRQGPGCPVCITTSREYEEAMTLVKRGKILTTYGDSSKVPGKHGSLFDLRGEGFDVRIVYGIEDAIQIAKETDKEVVFMAVGFETTAPSTAITIMRSLPSNFSILCCHRYLPPALYSLLDMGEIKIHGLLEPGHVSAIIGVKPYQAILEKYNIPQVIAGFEPLDMLMSVYMLANQIKKGKAMVENEYTRVVRYEGNIKALKVMDEVFEPFDVDWRGFPNIPGSGMKIKNKFADIDARKIYEDELTDISYEVSEEIKGCKCGEVLRGLINSVDCPLFGEICTPTHPIGPCMVSIEGSCNIEYKYGSQRKKII